MYYFYIERSRQPWCLSGLRRSRVHSLWLLVDHCVLRNWDRILVGAVKGLISRAGMVSICPLLWQRDVKLQQTYREVRCNRTSKSDTGHIKSTLDSLQSGRFGWSLFAEGTDLSRLILGYSSIYQPHVIELPIFPLFLDWLSQIANCIWWSYQVDTPLVFCLYLFFSVSNI